MTPDHQYCTFFLDDMFFGVEVRKVQEVIRDQEMTRVPLAHPVVAGLMNLRGQIVTAIDLRRRVGLPDRRPGRRPMNVVVQTSDGPVSLQVDEIGDVRDVQADAFELPPPTLRGEAQRLIRGAYKLTDRLLLALDVEQVLTLPVGEPTSSPLATGEKQHD